MSLVFTPCSEHCYFKSMKFIACRISNNTLRETITSCIGGGGGGINPRRPSSVTVAYMGGDHCQNSHPYSIIRGGREVCVWGGGGCYAMLQIVARQVQVPFHTNPNLMPYRWKPILFHCGRINKWRHKRINVTSAYVRVQNKTFDTKIVVQSGS